MFTRVYDSPLGRIRLASESGLTLCGLQFADAEEGRDAPVFDAACRWLDRYFAGENPGELPSLDLRGTAFQRKVWTALMKVPRGATVSYSGLCSLMGRQESACRAVGGALNRNPMLIMVPCHRVVCADGSLGGFAAGTAIKAALLALEKESRNLR